MKHLPHYQPDERTRYKVRIEINHTLGPAEIYWVKSLEDLEQAQIEYRKMRDEIGYGASQFGSGDVFDQFGQHLARISYNGRLWPAYPWQPGQEPLAEAPKETT